MGKQLGKNYRDLLTDEKANLNKHGKLILAYKNGKNLKQILVRSKLETNKKGAFTTCGQHKCKTCHTHASDCMKFRSTTYNKEFIIHDLITCSSSNLIYLITCRKCNLQYVGETSRTLRERVTDHRSAVKLKKKTPIGLHFNLPNHSVFDLKITAIELIKTNQNTDLFRKSKEKFWQQSLGTIYPKGLNSLPTE